MVVPLDGSERAEVALAPAVQLADRMEAELVLMAARWEAESVERIEQYLDARVAFLEHDARPLLVLDHSAPDAILVAGSEPGTVVCMTTHGRGGLASAILGSVAETVVRGSPGPVVLVGPRYRADWVLPDVPEVLAGFDRSDPSYAGVRAAGDLATLLGGRVRVVEMARRPDVLGTAKVPAGHVDALESVIAELHATGVDSTYEIVDGFDAAASLLDAAVRTDAALLALGTHGRRGIPRVALGSVTARVVHHAPSPVVVAHPA